MFNIKFFPYWKKKQKKKKRFKIGLSNSREKSKKKRCPDETRYHVVHNKSRKGSSVLSQSTTNDELFLSVQLQICWNAKKGIKTWKTYQQKEER